MTANVKNAKAQIMQVLRARMGRWTSADDVAGEIYPDIRHESLIAVHVNHLRRDLAGTKYRIDARKGPLGGYRLTRLDE